MYRVLDGTCLETETIDIKTRTSDFLPSDLPSRKIMQLTRNDNSSLILELAQEYDNLERQRKYVLQTMNKLIEENAENLKDSNNAGEFQQLFDNNFDVAKSYVITQHQSPYDGIIRPKYIINCTNIHQVRLHKKIGHGVSKQTFASEFNGVPVAVKMVTRHQGEVKTCIEQINVNHPKKEQMRSRCFVFSTMKLMKEILLLEQLNHPGFAQLLGYCIRNEESDTTDLRERGVVSVFELGERFLLHDIHMLSWQERVIHAMELADFLHYLEYSPLGSLRVRDFKEEHFLLVNNSLKMIDLDDVDNLEPSCNTYVNIETQSSNLKQGRSSGCEFSLPCQRGLCVGFNAKQNMKFMNKLYFKRLLYPTVFPRDISGEVGNLLGELDSDMLTANLFYKRLQSLLEQQG